MHLQQDDIPFYRCVNRTRNGVHTTTAILIRIFWIKFNNGIIHQPCDSVTVVPRDHLTNTSCSMIVVTVSIHDGRNGLARFHCDVLIHQIFMTSIVSIFTIGHLYIATCNTECIHIIHVHTRIDCLIALKHRVIRCRSSNIPWWRRTHRFNICVLCTSMLLQCLCNLNHLIVMMCWNVHDHHTHKVWLCSTRVGCCSCFNVLNTFFRQR